ncbi:MAG: hypothetical protein CSA65_02035 [Proteobacteria bacterium]|nr:MAG: hypothetical protein CSA65_02035 [Pseudomonadota bacterium]
MSQRPTESRVLRAVATVERLETPHPDDWTGEFSRPWDLAELSGSRPLPETEAASAAHGEVLEPARPRSRFELGVRLLVATLLLACAVAFVADAALLLIERQRSLVPLQRWREMPLFVDSQPAGAEVYIEDQRIGRTPLRSTQYCRGHVVRLRVTAAGYANWTWHGLCPPRGTLALDARLQALPK